jgi:cytochrome P460
LNLRIFGSLIVGAVAAALAFQAPGNETPEFTRDGEMVRPRNYREWVFLSSGLGMTYGPMASSEPRFDNVFVNRGAYRSFIETGRWPNGTTLVLEVRDAQSQGSINRGGHFQTAVVGLEVHVKDESRFAKKWAFFGFERDKNTATAFPANSSCFSCHEQHGAVDTTFVQFYPTLLEVAKGKGTFKN